jgi:hypothetical protein
VPLFRSHVLVFIPGLSNLDGRAVTEEERLLAPRVVEQEAARMAIMLSNACTVHKMVRVGPSGNWLR